LSANVSSAVAPRATLAGTAFTPLSRRDSKSQKPPFSIAIQQWLF
jgi:hypothetical protein